VKEDRPPLSSKDTFLWYMMNKGLGQTKYQPGCSDKILNSTARNRTPAIQFVRSNKQPCMGQTGCFINATKDLKV
jgi:hypothetical protein